MKGRTKFPRSSDKKSIWVRPIPSNRWTFFFEQGSARLRPQDLPKVADLTLLLHRNPDIVVRVRGHTVGRGSDDYNRILGTRRARAVATAMMRLGIASERIVTGSTARKRSLDGLGELDRRRRRRAEASLEDTDVVSLAVPAFLTDVWVRQRSAQVPAAA